jgi:hypothetical protein
LVFKFLDAGVLGHAGAGAATEAAGREKNEMMDCCCFDMSQGGESERFANATAIEQF